MTDVYTTDELVEVDTNEAPIAPETDTEVFIKEDEADHVA